MASRGTIVKGVAVVVVLAALGGGFYLYQLGSNFEQPTVESVNSEFGAVEADTTEVNANIVIDNPNEESIPGAASVGFAVTMNGVEMADGSKGGVGLQPGRNELNVTVPLRNEQIPAWWVTHVNNDERTEMVTKPSVSLTGIPVGVDLPSRTQTIETDLLGAVTSEGERTVGVGNDSLMVVSNQRASWGEATEETTPLVVETDIENVHDRPVELDGTFYTIEMNGVVVGNGTTEDSFSLAPGESGTFTARPAIDTPKMADWWATHIENDQTTRLSVRVYGLVERNGEIERVPITVFEREARLTTDLLGEGGTEVESLPTDEGETAYEPPSLVASTSGWGEVGETTTEIESELVVSNPNDGTVGDLVLLSVSQTTLINGVETADGENSLDGLEPGNNTLSLVSEFRHDAVPAWWARHLNRGEESAVVTRTNATADIGVTTLDAPEPSRSRTVTTDLLAEFNSSEPSEVQQEGRTVATIVETRATWGEATPETAPIDSEVTIRNEMSQSMTITDITYTVRLNDVALAENRTADGSYTIPPLTTRTIEPRFLLDNQRMADWWPTHVRNDEESVMTTEVYATVETTFGSKRVRFDSFSGERTVATDFFVEN